MEYGQACIIFSCESDLVRSQTEQTVVLQTMTNSLTGATTDSPVDTNVEQQSTELQREFSQAAVDVWRG